MVRFATPFSLSWAEYFATASLRWTVHGPEKLNKNSTVIRNKYDTRTSTIYGYIRYQKIS